LTVDSPAESAAVIRRILNGDSGPATRIVIANAAAALLAAEQVETLAQGVLRAEEAIQDGRALLVLETLANRGSF
jgi:anthranilate phosphoribosyltransferase